MGVMLWMASPSRVTVVEGQLGSGGMLRSEQVVVGEGLVPVHDARGVWAVVEAVEQRVTQGVAADAPASGDRVVGDGRGFAVEHGEWPQLWVVKADEVPVGPGGSGESPPVLGGQAGV
jgi:hypothetical protein